MRREGSLGFCVLTACLLSLGAAHAAYTVPPTLPVKDIRTLSMSEGNACAIAFSGALRCLGNNDAGQVGNGKSGNFVDYGEQIFASGVTSVATGPVHSCAVVKDDLYCWGDNVSGQIGNGTIGGTVASPVRIIKGGVTAVAVAGQTTCAIVSSALKCWGKNDLGQIGNGVSGHEPISTPTLIIPSGVTAVAVGGQHSCAVVRGALMCWGYMVDPNGPDLKTFPSPIKIIEQGVTAVAAAIHTCAVVNGSLQCWGRNFNGQVGVPEGPNVAPHVPVKVIESGVTDVVTNDYNTCAIVKGALYCWGSTFLMRLGVDMPPAYTPKLLIAKGVTAVATGMIKVCAVVEGTLQCTHRVPDPKQSQQDWNTFGTNNTPFVVPEPELPKLRYGLWRGTIGKKGIMALLLPEGGDSSYYYLRHLWGISLTVKDRRGLVWEEQSTASATWQLEFLSADMLRGVWTDDAGQRSVPIQLSLIAPIDDPTKIGTLNEKYNGPRLAALKMMSEEAEFQKYKYHRVTILAGAMEGVEVLSLPNLNKVMSDWLRSSAEEYYDCQLRTSTRQLKNDPAPDYFKKMEPVLWSDGILVLQETFSAYCGGAHPDGGVNGYLVWDVTEDKSIEPWDWIRDSNGEYGSRHPPAALNQLIHDSAGIPDDDECSEAIDSNDYYLIYPGRYGMVFLPVLPHVVQACANEIVVPYNKLRPYLTANGGAKMDSLFDGQ